MQSPAGWLLYLLFIVIQFGMYLSIRREWIPPGLTAGLGIVTSVALMILISLSQGNTALQAVVVGILVGAVFSVAILAIAWYFHSSELRKRPPAPPQPPQAGIDEEEY